MSLVCDTDRYMVTQSHVFANTVIHCELISISNKIFNVLEILNHVGGRKSDTLAYSGRVGNKPVLRLGVKHIDCNLNPSMQYTFMIFTLIFHFIQQPLYSVRDKS